MSALKRLVLTGLLLTFACTFALAQEGKPPKRKLTFETVEDPLAITVPEDIASEITHVAMIRCDESGQIVLSRRGLTLSRRLTARLGEEASVPDRREDRFGDFLFGTTACQATSEKQRKLLEEYMEFCFNVDKDSKRTFVFTLAAVSEEDARKMAEAFIETANKVNRLNLEAAREEFEQERNAVADAEARIPKLDKVMEERASNLAALKRRTFYRNYDDAMKSGLELNMMLSTIEVDIAGIQAKIEAIKKHITEKTNDDRAVAQEQLKSLEQMLTLQDIELAGALARKKAMLDQREMTNIFCKLTEDYDRVKKERNSLAESMKESKRRSMLLEGWLTGPPPDMHPITVVDNKVFIAPANVTVR